MTYETDKLAQLAGRMLSPGTRAHAHGADPGCRPPTAPAHVYLLAEHLDACLAAGEDLLAESFTWNAANPKNEEDSRLERATLAQTLSRVRTLEMILIGRVMRARTHAETLAETDRGFRPIVNLFITGTVPFVEAVAAFKDRQYAGFRTGNGVTSYLRTRGLIEPDAAAPLDGSTVRIVEGFLVASRIPLGPLLDLVAQFLDTLELHYDIFPEKGQAPAGIAPRTRVSLQDAIAALSAASANEPTTS